MTDRPGPRALSPTGLKTWLTCPRQWWYKYVLKVPDSTGPAAVLGSFTHRVLERLIDVEPDRRCVEEAFWLIGDEWPIFAAANADDVAATGVTEGEARRVAERATLAAFYLADPGTKPVLSAEQKVSAEIDGVPTFCIIDRTDARDHAIEVIDYKTGRYRPSASTDVSRQLTFNALAVEAAGLGEVVSARGLFLLEPEPVDKRVRLARGDRDRVRKQIVQVWTEIGDALETGEFKAKPRAPWPCKWCLAADRCPEGRRALQRAA